MFPAFRLQDSMQRITLGKDHRGISLSWYLDPHAPCATASLGERDWNRLHQSIEDQRRILEYRNLHQGRDPPPPPGEQWTRTCCPCFFPAKIKISPALLQEAGYLP